MSDDYYDQIEDEASKGRDPEKEPEAPKDWPKITDQAPAEPDDD